MSGDRQLPVIVGRPFAPIGRGEDARCVARSFAAAYSPLPLLDMYRLVNGHSNDNIEDPATNLEFGSRLVDRLSERLNIYLINGDEVQFALDRKPDCLPAGAKRVVYPQWELSRYPDEWAKQLDRFDEIWAPSRFVYDALKTEVTKPLYYLPLPTEVHRTRQLGRRYFGIRESSFAFLFFFDFRSYISRKNPLAALKAFAEVQAARPFSDTILVLKINRPDPTDSPALNERFIEFMRQVRHFGSNVTVIDKVFDDNEIKNLVHACDCFLSLHRSEGYGRGLSEAMYLGKPAIGTAYSGNMDFMTAENSLLVPYKLVPVQDGEYPFPSGQEWADPDPHAAAEAMIKLIDNPGAGREMGLVARQDIRTHFSYRATGLRYLQRVKELLGEESPRLSTPPSTLHPLRSVDYMPLRAKNDFGTDAPVRLLVSYRPSASSNSELGLSCAAERIRSYGVSGFLLVLSNDDAGWLASLGSGEEVGVPLGVRWQIPQTDAISAAPAFVKSISRLVLGTAILRRDDRPMLFVQTHLVENDLVGLASVLRAEFASIQATDPYLVLGLCKGFSGQLPMGWDAGFSIPAEDGLDQHRIEKRQDGTGYSYPALVSGAILREFAAVDFPIYATIFPGSANSSRSFSGGTPQMYRLWVQRCADRVLSREIENLVIIDAWAGENGQLAPSDNLGFAYLEETRNGLLWAKALQRYVSGEVIPLDPFMPDAELFAEPAQDPILVFQMAKVGSSSVVAALRALNRPEPVVHVHILTDFEGIEKKQVRRMPSPKLVLEQLEHFKTIRKWIDDAPAGTIPKVITMMREPVGRNISAFFESIELYYPNFVERLDRDELTLEDVTETFLHLFIQRIPEVWFNMQLRATFDIDVFSEPFDHEKGYGILRNSRCETLVFRTEDLDRAFEAGIEEFLGWKGVRPVTLNTAEDKKIRSFIKKFASQPFPDWYLTAMYSTQAATHFYTPEELARFRRKYSAPVTG